MQSPARQLCLGGSVIGSVAGAGKHYFKHTIIALANQRAKQMLMTVYLCYCGPSAKNINLAWVLSGQVHTSPYCLR
jgi:hypothetical protein